MFKTYVTEPESQWVLIDAEGQTLGRLAAQIAHILRGKHKPTFMPNQLCGDFVVVVNAEKIHLTGKKLTDKIYTRFTGYPGGLKETSAGEMLKRHPERMIEKAVWGMLPHGPLGRQMIRRLKVYAGPKHPHQAQRPQVPGGH
jgi:large subunit ribosomal protein L13